MTAPVRRAAFAPGQRVLAVSDLHGAPKLLYELLRKLAYRPGVDALVLVGDFTEKGPDNLGAVRLAMQLAKLPDVYVLRGNCDGLCNDLEEEGTADYLARSGQVRWLLWELCAEAGIPREKALADLPAAARLFQERFGPELAFLKSLPVVLDTPRLTFVHAGLGPGPLEEQEEETCLCTPAFFARAGRMDKLTVVGHWPVCNYGGEICDCAPRFDGARRILAIDGGNQVKSGGQLNAAVLRGGCYEGFESADGLPVMRVKRPCPEGGRRVNIFWPDYEVEVLGGREGLCRCRHLATGRVFEAPEFWLRRGPEGVRLRDDYTALWLPLAKGQRVALAGRWNNWALVKQGSRLGWAPADALEGID